ncbi:RidA family protein [Deferrisoma palaeochoriense]
MKPESVYTPDAPEPGPYSQAVVAGGFVFVAGQTAEDPTTNRPVHGTVAEQAELIMKNISKILEAAGSGLDRVVRCDVYLSSMDVKNEFNEVYRRYFTGTLPARNCVAVAGIDDGLDVEIEVIALLK